MSLDFSAFLTATERRSRRLRACRIAGVILGVLGMLSFAFAAALRLAGLHVSFATAAGLVLGALAVAIAAYVVAYRHPVRVPSLLLHLDEHLGLEERLSSLYELRRRGGDSIFRRRLEARLPFDSLPWKKALPLPTFSIALLSAGLLLLGGTLGVAAWSAPGHPDGSIPVATAPAESEESTDATSSAPTETFTESADPLSQTDVGQPENTPPPGVAPEDDFSLTDVLAELQVRSASDAVVDDSRTDLEDLAAQQAEAARQLSETLESIRQRLQEEGGGLTPQEQEQLRQAMGSASPQMQQALSDLLNETDPDRLQESVSQLLASPQGGEPADSEQESTLAAVPDDADDPFESPDPSDEDETGEGEGTGEGQPEEGPGMAGSPGGEEAEGDDGQAMRPGGEDEAEGGDEGASAASDSMSEDESGFVRETVQGSIGDTGEITEFITAGVPLEPASGEPDAGASGFVSFDRIRSILEARGLPQEARDAVRAYFEAISQGGS